MKIKELWNKIRKGVKAGMAAATESNVLTDNRVVSMIEKFKASGKYELMKEGERYYQADNDIKNRKITRKVDGHLTLSHLQQYHLTGDTVTVS